MSGGGSEHGLDVRPHQSRRCLHYTSDGIVQCTHAAFPVCRQSTAPTLPIGSSRPQEEDAAEYGGEELAYANKSVCWSGRLPLAPRQRDSPFGGVGSRVRQLRNRAADQTGSASTIISASTAGSAKLQRRIPPCTVPVIQLLGPNSPVVGSWANNGPRAGHGT